MLSRRDFLKLGAAAGAGAMLPLKWGEDARAFNLLGQGLPLNPLLLTKFVDPLPIPAAIDARGGGIFEMAARPGSAVVVELHGRRRARLCGHQRLELPCRGWYGDRSRAPESAAPTSVLPS